MPLKIFVSSEMTNKEDIRRRKAVIREIEELNHSPVYFENLPSRPLPEKQSSLDKCCELVRQSNILIAIIDDTVSESMRIEIDEAVKSLGQDKILYYFTKTGNRDETARKLWRDAAKGYILKEFQNTNELKKEIKKTIGSYYEDAMLKKKKIETVLNEVIELHPNQEEHRTFEFEKGDIVTITCIGSSKFFVDFYSREKYAQLRGLMFNFPIGSDKLQDTGKFIIPETDDYYLVLRKSLWHTLPVKVHVKIKVEKP